MDVGSTVLVLVDRAGGAQAALQKASLLARHLGAVIELFSCDAEHAGAVRRLPTDPAARDVIEACFNDNSRYLEALRSSVVARDLDIRQCVACAASVIEGLAARVAALSPLLVVCGVVEGGMRGSRLTLRPELIQLVKQVTAPILLTRGAPWAPSPRIAMAPDFDAPDPDTRERVLEIAHRLGAGCHGSLMEAEEGASRESRALCEFVDRGQADILVVAGCSRPQAFASREPELEALLGAVTCDLLIVPRSPVDSSTVTRFAVAFRANSANRQP